MMLWHKGKSIANQLQNWFLLFGILSVLVTSAALIYISFQKEQRNIHNTLHAKARGAAREVDEYMLDLHRKLNYLARVRGLTELSSETQKNLLEALIRHNSAYELVAIINGKGDVVHDVSPYGHNLPRNIANRNVFFQTFQAEADYISPVQIDSETHLPSLDFGVPIRNKADEVDGVLLARINLRFLGFVLSRMRIGATGYVYIIDYRNIVIAQKGVPFQQLEPVDLTHREEILRQTDLITHSHVPYSGLLGSQVQGAAGVVHCTHWKIVVELPLNEAYASLRQMLIIMIGIVIAILISGGGLAFLLSKQLVNPLHELSQAAKQISSGDFEVRVKYQEQNELGLLADTFNAMVERIKEREEALRESEARWRSLIENSPDNIAELNLEGTILFPNRVPSHLTLDEVIGTSLYEHTPAGDHNVLRQAMESVLHTGETAAYDALIPSPEGEKKWWSCRIVPIKRGGRISGFLAIGTDITERRQMEAQIKASLEEKEVLLRELYHRTKNNMQVICSMLALQSAYTQDEQVLKIFQETENRIKSMALVHQKLYQSENLSSVDLKVYINDLAELLVRSYRVESNRILLIFDMDSLPVLIDTAIPCGLILNELISNSLKYAFPGEMEGEIRIQLRKTGEGEIELQVSDNGVGIPEGFDFRKSETMGLQNVFAIVEHQLQGEVKFEVNNGITCQIRFKDTPSRKRV